MLRARGERPGGRALGASGGADAADHDLSEYPERFCVSKAELLNFGGAAGDGRALCQVADILILLEKGCARDGVERTDKIRSCVVFVLDLLMQIRRGDVNENVENQGGNNNE